MDLQQMQLCGQINFGDMVNVFRHGFLTMQHDFNTFAPTQGSILFGTVNGAIGEKLFQQIQFFQKSFSGLVTQVPQEFYEFLMALGSRLVKVIESVGNINHYIWRSFETEMGSRPYKNFIDGDLVESFLDLPRETMQKVCLGLQVR
jgi:DNA damage-binding protein 1